MNGIVFFRTQRLEHLRRFYLDEVGCEIWLEQADCLILRHGNLLLGFCDRDAADLQGTITFVYDTREEVDRMFDRLRAAATTEPDYNPKYRIYHFFAKDPEGRAIEFQRFEEPVPAF